MKLINVKRTSMIRTSDIGPEQLKEWNNGAEFNLRDLDNFVERNVKARSVISKAMEYIANASDSSLIRNVDYLLSVMVVDADVKWVEDTVKRAIKFEKKLHTKLFFFSLFLFSFLPQFRKKLDCNLITQWDILNMGSVCSLFHEIARDHHKISKMKRTYIDHN